MNDATWAIEKAIETLNQNGPTGWVWDEQVEAIMKLATRYLHFALTGQDQPAAKEPSKREAAVFLP